MINYTERISLLMEDVVSRVPTLSFIDMSKVLVFARGGRTHAEGAYATCHCICLPPSEPGYYFWRDRKTGRLTRRSEWFVTKSPQVSIGTQSIDYMISFALPRFCEQQLSRSRKSVHYAGEPNWIAKLDTIVHELYHIDPAEPGIRRMERAAGATARAVPVIDHGARAADLQRRLTEAESQLNKATEKAAAREKELDELIGFLRQENDAAQQTIERLSNPPPAPAPPVNRKRASRPALRPAANPVLRPPP